MNGISIFMGFKDLWEQFYEFLLENCKEISKDCKHNLKILMQIVTKPQNSAT